jgi:hypothetical protein
MKVHTYGGGHVLVYGAWEDVADVGVVHGCCGGGVSLR